MIGRLLFAVFGLGFKLISYVAHIGDLRGMAYKYYAFALQGEFAEYLHDFVLSIAVKVSGRLVGENNIRIVRKRSGDGNALPLSGEASPDKSDSRVVFPLRIFRLYNTFFLFQIQR